MSAELQIVLTGSEMKALRDQLTLHKEALKSLLFIARDKCKIEGCSLDCGSDDCLKRHMEAVK